MATGLGALDRDLQLRLGCSVFLSHSGADKDFVRFLHERLVQKGYRVFFDEESLPKAVPLSMRNILAELKGVKLAVLVLSNAFFTRTQHPMRELATIVATKIQMLPIFYEFSVPQFEVNRRERAWLQEWMGWVHKDVINGDTIREWEDALEVVSRTNGLEFCKEACNSLELRDKIVARVCQILKPDIQWSAQGLQGMDRLCQIVSQRFEALATLRLEQRNPRYRSSFMILGMQGIDGLGKSSLCKALCDFFFQEFESRVCYIELGDYTTTAIQQRLQFAYTWLIGGPAPLQHLTVQQLWNLLRERLEGCGSRPVFLAIDNVQLDNTSFSEALELLSLDFPEGSKIFVTSQSEDVLSRLRRQADSAYFKVVSFPHLSYSEARDIFVYKLFRGRHNTLSQQQEHVVDDCVQMCTLNKLQSDYYPVMLVVLASYMVQINRDPLQWRSKVEEMKRDGIFASSDGLKWIFKRAYDSLTEDQRLMLIDLALYLPDTLNRYPTRDHAKKLWLEPTYASLQDVDETISQLADLSLLESRDSSVINSDICFRVHDLVREFVKKEVSKSKSCIFMERHTVKLSASRQLLKRRHIERLGISNCRFEDATLDLSRIEKIDVLHLVGNRGLKSVRLSRMGWLKLQSLVVLTTTRMNICVVEANMEPQAFYLQLENCVLISENRDPSCFRESSSNAGLQHRGHMFLESNSTSSDLTWGNLLYLDLFGVLMFEQLGEGYLVALPQLFVLKLGDLPYMWISLSLDKFPRIREISLYGLPKLEAISGLDNSSNLVRVSITKCNTPRSLVLLDKGASYKINECKALESIKVHQSQLNDEHDEVAEGSLCVSGCSLVHISGLSQRQFIGTVSYEVGGGEKSLECTPKSLEHIVFENSGDSIQPQMGTATVTHFMLKHEGLQELELRDVRDLSSFLAALRRTSGSSLERLKISCRRHDECGCHRPAHQPHFDYFKMALKVLCYSCSRVMDLSSLENCSSMEVLCLYGCVAAVKWPDFGKMTSLVELTVESPGSLAYWPCGLQNHPSLDDLIIIGSNQIPPEELLACVTSMDPQSHSRLDRLSSFAALEILVDDVYYSRKDKLHIAKALMSSQGNLLCIIDKILPFTCRIIGGDDEEIADEEDESDNVLHRFEARKQLQVTDMRFFHLLSQLLYGLWVEADCSLHECSLSCGTERIQMELLQDSLQGLLSSKTMISALLLTIPEGSDLWSDQPAHLWLSFTMLPRCLPCKSFRSRYAYESLVLISFASIERFKVQMEEELPELVNEIKHIVDSFFGRWKWDAGRNLPLLLRDDKVSDRFKESGDDFFRYIEHQLSAVRVADAVWRLGQLAGGMHGERGHVVESAWPAGKRFKSRRRIAQRSFTKPIPGDPPSSYKLEYDCAQRLTRAKENLGALVEETYRKYQDMRARFTEDAQYQDSQAVRKQWHHPVGCFCGLRRRQDYHFGGPGAGHLPPDYSVFSSDLLKLRLPTGGASTSRSD